MTAGSNPVGAYHQSVVQQRRPLTPLKFFTHYPVQKEVVLSCPKCRPVVFFAESVATCEHAYGICGPYNILRDFPMNSCTVFYRKVTESSLKQ